MRSIFVSYRHADSADVTGRITDRLGQEFGADEIFVDVHAIPLGRDFRAEIEEKLGQCAVVLAIVGPDWMGVGDDGRSRLEDPGDYVRIELEIALKRNIPVIPVLVEHARMPAQDQLPESLRAFHFRNATPVRPDPDFHNDMDRLIRGLRQTGIKGGSVTPLRARSGSLTLARGLALALVVAEILQVGVFLVTDANDVRLVSVSVANALGAAVLLANWGEQNTIRIALGVTAIVAPWLFRFLVEPVLAVVAAAVLVCVLAALFLLRQPAAVTSRERGLVDGL